jgi:hypothetical protein
MTLVRSFVVIILLASAPAAEPRLTVYPRVALDSGVRIEAFIPRHADNRRMGLVVDGPIYRSFEEPLEGEHARALFGMTLDRLDEGRYEVFLTVVKVGGVQRTIHSEFCRGGGCFEEPI